jgi:raffinose/stachyose/melibiose transport system permease protein
VRTTVRERALNALIYLFVVVVAATCLVPYIWIFFASLKNNTEMFQHPFALPAKWLWNNYPEAWRVGRFGLLYGNTLLVTGLSIGVLIPVSVLAAYAFAKIDFYGRKTLLYAVLFGLIIPFQAYMISLYYTLRDLKMLNTYWAMIMPLVAVNIPFAIFYMRAFLLSLPSDLLDAARVDGATELQTIAMIVVPMAKSAIVSLGIFQGVLSWNAFMIPLLYVHKAGLRPITLGLMYFRGEYTSQYDLSMAAAIIVSLPLIIAFLMFRRGFVRGLAGGAFK